VARITDTDVVALIEVNSQIPLTGFINTANLLTTWLSECDTDSELSAAELTQIEAWLAAHFYAQRDPQYQVKKTGNASATFQGSTGMHLDGTWWGQQAMMLDTTGCLARRNEEVKTGRKRKAGVLWAGLAPSNQTDYVDRD